MRRTRLEMNATFELKKKANYRMPPDGIVMPQEVQDDIAKGGMVSYRRFEVFVNRNLYRNCMLVSIRRNNKRDGINYLWVEGHQEDLYIVEHNNTPTSIVLFMAYGLELVNLNTRSRTPSTSVIQKDNPISQLEV